MSNILIPCPFCGNKPSLLKNEWGRTIYAYVCSNPRCLAYHQKNDYSIGHLYQWDLRSAADVWNRRAE